MLSPKCSKTRRFSFGLVFAVFLVLPALGRTGDPPTGTSRSSGTENQFSTPENRPSGAAVRPGLPTEAAARVVELEARIEKLTGSWDDNDLSEAIRLAGEVLEIRMEHQGSAAEWTTPDGKPTEWYELGDARRRVEDLKRFAALAPASKAELDRADACDPQRDTLYKSRKFDETLDIATSQLEIHRRVLGDDHPITLNSIHNMGYSLISLGRFDEAAAFYREALEGRRRVLGDEHPQTLNTINSMGHALEQQGRYAEAEPYYREALKGRRRVLGDDHSKTMISINNVASLLGARGRYDEAEPLFREALDRRRRVLGDDDPDTLISIGNLGGLLQSRGKHAEAEPFYREALEGSRRVLGNEHPSTLTRINNMGGLLKSRGRYAEAELLLREALEGRRRVLGNDDPLTLSSINNMGLLLSSRGRRTEAEPYYRDALEGRRRVLGDDHPDTLTSINNMGFFLAAQGKYDEAEAYCLQALDGRRRVLGDDHPKTLTTINSMGHLLESLGRYAEAEIYSREALENRRRVLGNDHPDTLTSVSNMGVLFQSQGRYAEAGIYSREALDGFRRVFGDDHPYTLKVVNNMASLLKIQGRYAEAEPYHREALEGSRRVLGNDHPSTLTTINNMGSLLKARGRYAEAEPYYREALEGRRRVQGDDHRLTLTAISNMGILLKSQGRHAEAEPYYREALEGYRRVLGNDHPSTLGTINNMGTLLKVRDRYAEAESYYREALDGCRRVEGDDHPNTLTSINNLGSLLKNQGRYAEAEPYSREALKKRRRVLGDNHPYTLTSINNLGSLLESQGRYAEAEPFYREAVESYRRVLGDDHPGTAVSLNLMAGLLNSRGDYTAAESMWAEAEKSFEKTRLRVSHGGLKRAEFTAQSSPLASLAACLARNGKPLPAWERLEANMARGLLDTLSARHSRPLKDKERNREENLIGQLNKLDERIGALAAKQEKSDQSSGLAEELRNERERLQAELALFEAEMVSKYGAAAGEVFGLSRIQAQMAEDSALLAWVDIEGDSHAVDPGGEHWGCVVKKAGEPIWIKLPGSGNNDIWTKNDDELARRLRNELGRWAPGPAAQYRAGLIRQLHAQRLEPVEPHLSGVHHLIVLPAGKMAGIPVEALTDKYTVSYAPSGTMYAWLGEKAPGAGQRDRKEPGLLLALGDPVFPKPVEPEDSPPKPPDHGVLIAMVTPESNALRSGLREGDVLLSFGDSKLSGPEELRPAIQQAQEEVEAVAQETSPERAQAREQEGAQAQGQAPVTVEHSDDTPQIPVTVWRDGETLQLAVAPGKLGVRKSKRPVPEAVVTRRRLDAAMEPKRGAVFDPIPHTRTEVKAIAGLFRREAGMVEIKHPGARDTSLILLGKEASEQRLDAMAVYGELKNFRYIHLATHGVMDDHTAMNSAMILSQDNLPDVFERALAGGEVFDGRLTAEQIVRTWKLDADLVSLSGCETALGKESGGEGFLGFSQALFVAGARSLLLSLWKVDDRATMLLMKRFYENILGGYAVTRRILDRDYEAGMRMPNADALGEAKQWLRNLTRSEVRELLTVYPGIGNRSGERSNAGAKAPMASHPFQDPQYWAAFILLGDPD